LVEAFDFAAGLGMVGAGVAEADAAGMQGDFEGYSAGAAVAAGEHRTVVAEQAGRVAMGGSGFGETVVDVAGLEHREGVAAEAQPGVIVEDVEDLHVGVIGQRPVSDVQLPAFVGLFGGEADVAAFGAFVWLGSDEASGAQDPPDRRHRGAFTVALLKVSGDRGRAGLMSVAFKVLAQRDDLVLDVFGGAPWATRWSS
jgi:hypothetical protein